MLWGLQGTLSVSLLTKRGERPETGWQDTARGLQRTLPEAVSNQHWRRPLRAFNTKLTLNSEPLEWVKDLGSIYKEVNDKTAWQLLRQRGQGTVEAQRRKQLFGGGLGLSERKGDIEVELWKMNRSLLEDKRRNHLPVRRTYIRHQDVKPCPGLSRDCNHPNAPGTTSLVLEPFTTQWPKPGWQPSSPNSYVTPWEAGGSGLVRPLLFQRRKTRYREGPGLAHARRIKKG